MSSERSVKDLSGPYIKRLVGANGFEPSTSWSRTKHLNPINALSGVAYGTRSLISPLLVVPNLYLADIFRGLVGRRKTELVHIEPGRPVQNAYSTTRNGRTAVWNIWRRESLRGEANVMSSGDFGV